jgi:hypothetical protein
MTEPLDQIEPMTRGNPDMGIFKADQHPREHASL